MSFENWAAFAAASTILLIIPGPTILLVVSYALGQGWRTALPMAVGVALGDFTAMTLSMLGIGALLQTASGALTVLKVVGGAYLVWLGIQLWRAPPLKLDPATAGTTAADARGRVLFRQGLLSAVSNPKVLLFYGAFLPQFLDASRPLLLQFAILAGTFAGIEAVVEYLLARLAHRVRPWLERTGRTFNRVCGGLFAAMGVALPLTR